MKNLFDIIKESIFDDEEEQLNKVESTAKRPELKKLVRLLWLKGYRIGSDDKTIISKKFGDYYGRKEHLFLSDFNTDTLKKFHTLGLQFHPISYLSIEQKELDSLKYFRAPTHKNASPANCKISPRKRDVNKSFSNEDKNGDLPTINQGKVSRKKFNKYPIKNKIMPLLQYAL